jgi:photosystem II stability/assembly factor-like uncharacterized protein
MADSGNYYNFVSVASSNPLNCTVLGYELNETEIQYDILLMRTKDGGITWQRQACPFGGGLTVEDAKLRRICAIDSLNLFAVGDSGLMIRTTDAGEHWVQIGELWTQLDTAHAWNYNFIDVRFADPLHGIATTTAGNVAITNDGGSTWKFTYFPRAREMFASSISDSCYFAISGTIGNMYRTFDGGLNWDTISIFRDTYTGTTGTFLWGSYFRDNAKGFVVGGTTDGVSPGYIALILRTSDAGLHWDTVCKHDYFDGYDDIMAIRFADSLHGVAATRSTGVLKSSDGGSTWTADSIPMPFQWMAAFDIAYPSLDRMFLCASGGYNGYFIGFSPEAASVATSAGNSVMRVGEVYPNPFRDRVTIVLPDAETKYDVTLVDLLGRTVRFFPNVGGAKATLEIPGISPGEYFVRASHEGITKQQYPLIAE